MLQKHFCRADPGLKPHNSMSERSATSSLHVTHKTLRKPLSLAKSHKHMDIMIDYKSRVHFKDADRKNRRQIKPEPCRTTKFLSLFLWFFS